MADLQTIRLMGTTQEMVERLNGNFTELEQRKVDKELKTGSQSVYKVLSDNNYTDAEKTKLSEIPTLGTAAVLDAGTSAGNVPVLDSNGKLSSSTLPAIAISDTFVVASEAAMLALTVEVGDIAVRTDLNKSFILKEDGASTLSHWQELLTPPDTVSSVNGKTGTVVLDASDVGASKVEPSQINGNIKIDGVETTVYTLPIIDQITEYNFAADDANWGSAVDGIYTLTITSAKRPIVCYNSNGEIVMATLGYNGTNITLKTDTKFAGKILAI